MTASELDEAALDDALKLARRNTDDRVLLSTSAQRALATMVLTLVPALRAARQRIAELRDLLALHNMPDVAALNVYIGTIEQREQEARDELAGARQLLRAYRDKRSCDGLNGRIWDALRHAEADADVARLEAARAALMHSDAETVR